MKPGEVNKGEITLGDEENADFKQIMQGKGRGVGDLQGDTSKELNPTIDTTVWFLELGTESQYAGNSTTHRSSQPKSD